MRKIFGILLLVLLAIGGLFLAFGHMETYNRENEGEVLGEYMGVATVCDEETALEGDFLQNGRYEPEGGVADGLKDGDQVDVYMDFDVIHVYYEKRTMLTGKLVEEEDGLVYRVKRVSYHPTEESEEAVRGQIVSFDHALVVYE